MTHKSNWRSSISYDELVAEKLVDSWHYANHKDTQRQWLHILLVINGMEMGVHLTANDWRSSRHADDIVKELRALYDIARIRHECASEEDWYDDAPRKTNSSG